MIGVFCQDFEKEIFAEFFELFKTPWEVFDPSHIYDVILSTRPNLVDYAGARLIIVYSSNRTVYDNLLGLTLQNSSLLEMVLSENGLLPIYRGVTSISGNGIPLLQMKSTGASVAVELFESKPAVVRVGYNLGEEISFILLESQPVEFAQYPSLDMHINLLRSWILKAGVSLLEIPPRPIGYEFFACITHDIDFTGIRNHKFDKTMWGFVYRALIGSLIDLFKSKIDIRMLMMNWLAVLKLPFVFMRLAKDFWKDFDDYAAVDRGFSSTFFLVPIKNYAGIQKDNQPQHKRAVPYQINEVSNQVKHLIDLGYEIGLHGIDAWNSSDLGAKELSLVTDVIGQRCVGIRMHWLFFDRDTPRKLEQAGFEYDATLGYNDNVGYRNGTTQVFRPIGVNELMEIPLHIQDTALFFPRRLNLDLEKSRQLCQPMISFVSGNGGVLTISWHERSLKPERLWGNFYKWLLDELQARNAWIGNAQQITDWFRTRRSFGFRPKDNLSHGILIDAPAKEGHFNPQIFFRLHVPLKSENSQTAYRDNFRDIPWDGERVINISLEGEMD